MFDSFMGGGFGFGLPKNVREAYNWLIDHYQENDEIYIFGFSRGAYTARSLVGLIASCGLLKRGAPLTVNQMWNGYGFISKHRGYHGTKNRKWWESQIDKDKTLFRRINSYQKDKWIANEDKLDNPIKGSAEELVEKWSRRIEITYLGIFATEPL